MLLGSLETTVLRNFGTKLNPGKRFRKVLIRCEHPRAALVIENAISGNLYSKAKRFQ